MGSCPAAPSLGTGSRGGSGRTQNGGGSPGDPPEKQAGGKLHSHHLHPDRCADPHGLQPHRQVQRRWGTRSFERAALPVPERGRYHSVRGARSPLEDGDHAAERGVPLQRHHQKRNRYLPDFQRIPGRLLYPRRGTRQKIYARSGTISTPGSDRPAGKAEGERTGDPRPAERPHAGRRHPFLRHPGKRRRCHEVLPGISCRRVRTGNEIRLQLLPPVPV